MKALVKPLLIIAFISFLLGIGLKMQDVERQLTNRFKSPHTIRLLTDQPEWWKPLIEPVKYDLNINLEVITVVRNRWADILEMTPSQCNLVAFPSYYTRNFAESSWLETWPASLTILRDQIRADFRRPRSDPNEIYFWPLLWNAAFWTLPEHAPNTKKEPARFLTSPEEALLFAQTRNAVPNPEIKDEESEEEVDWHKIAEKAYANFLPEIANLGPAQQEYLSQKFPVEVKPSKDEIFSRISLITYGLGLCRNSLDEVTLRDFMNWLLQPEPHTKMVLAAKWLSSLNASDSTLTKFPQYRPENIRRLPLSNLQQSDLPWAVSAAWFEVYK